LPTDILLTDILLTDIFLTDTLSADISPKDILTLQQFLGSVKQTLHQAMADWPNACRPNDVEPYASSRER
jgi:hypothetical protein